MYFYRQFVCLVGLYCAALVAIAGEEPAVTAAERLSQQFASMQTMQANFSQKITDEKGQLLQEAAGAMVVKRPRQFYWHTTSPYDHLIVANGDVLWIYDVDLEQVSRQPFSDDLDRAPALILSGESAKLSQQYSIALTESVHAGKDHWLFVLTPNTADNVFQQLRMSFVDNRLSGMILVDSFEQTTTIQFSDVVYNVDIDEQRFQFSPPANIDVIDNDP